MLKLSLFGSLTALLASDDHDAQQLNLPSRPGGMLAFLAVHRGCFFTRAEVLQRVWGDSAAGRAGSFNTALWRLRKMIERPPVQAGDYIVTNPQGAVGLNGPGYLWLDVAEFNRLTHPGLSKPLQHVTPSEVCDMQQALTLYSGDFLVDVSSGWALSERERLRRAYINTLGRLADLGAAAADYAGAIRYAQSILDIDPLREDVHRQLMRYFVLNGQRALALRQFELCREGLRRELAIQPMPETVALYQRIAATAVNSARAPVEVGDLVAAPARAMPSEPISIPGVACDHLASARTLIAEVDQHLQAAMENQGVVRS